MRTAGLVALVLVVPAKSLAQPSEGEATGALTEAGAKEVEEGAATPEAGEKRGGSPAAAPGRPVPENRVGTFIDRLALSGLVQARYVYVEKGTAPTGERIPRRNSFSVGRARLQLDGDITERLDFRLYFDLFYRSRGLQLLEARVTLTLLDPEAQLLVGQFQPVTIGEGKATFWQLIQPGRSGETMVVGQLDRGIGIRGRLWNRRILYEARLVNGNGIGDERGGGNDNVAMRWGAVVKFEPLGPIPLFQDDLDRGPLRFGAGLAAFRSRDRDTVAHHQDKTWWGVNAYLRGWGLYAKGIYGTLEVDQAGTSRDQAYLSAQVGYAIRTWLGHTLEPLARYTQLRTDPDLESESVIVGLNYFLAGRQARLQVNYAFEREANVQVDNDALRLACTITY